MTLSQPSLQPILVGRVTALRKKSRERSGHNEKALQSPQLTLWPESCAWEDDQRGVPNALLRSALFAAIHGNNRRVLKRELIAAVDGIALRFTGEQLEQSDLNVWETVIHFARLQGSVDRVEFTAHAMLRELGLNTGRNEHQWLKESFARLFSAGIEITVSRYTYGGALLTLVRDENTGRYVVHLKQGLIDLFQAGWTCIDWEVRKRLRRQPLALWLHGMYSSHASPYPYSVRKIHELSGSNNQQLSGFTRQLRKALQALQDEGAIDRFEIGKGTDGLVKIWRTPSASQKRHLFKKSPQSRQRVGQQHHQNRSLQLPII